MGSTWGPSHRESISGLWQPIAFSDFWANHYSAPFKTTEKTLLSIFIHLLKTPKMQKKEQSRFTGSTWGLPIERIFGLMADDRIF